MSLWRLLRNFITTTVNMTVDMTVNTSPRRSRGPHGDHVTVISCSGPRGRALVIAVVISCSGPRGGHLIIAVVISSPPCRHVCRVLPLGSPIQLSRRVHPLIRTVSSCHLIQHCTTATVTYTHTSHTTRVCAGATVGCARELRAALNNA